jgi:hypothetical protein
MNVGKLYQFKKLCWMLFPSKDIAARAAALDLWTHQRIPEAEATQLIAYSKRFNCKVSYIEPNSIFVFLEQDGYCCKILSTNGELGWIYITVWCKDDIEEVNQ